MTDREKLIELLGKDTCKHDCCLDCEHNKDHDTCITYLKNSMADLLIASGVTFQKWIPVTERLPENRNEVLVCTKNEYYGTQKVSKARCCDGEWHGTGGRWTNVTHWMPLPEPPEIK